MRKLFMTILMVLFFLTKSFAADISILSQVDKSVIEMGDSIQLTVTIKKPMQQSINNNFGNSGFSISVQGFNFNSMDDIDFNIDSIPNFDIAGRSQSSRTRSINGVGETVKDIVLKLVPQKDGEFVIPAFSIKDKEGVEHHSDPIKVTVKKVADDPEEEASESNEDTSTSTSSSSDNDSEKKSQNNQFLYLLIFGIILTFIVIGIIFIFYIFVNNNQQKNDTNQIEDAEIVKVEPKTNDNAVKTDIEKSETTENVEKVEFNTIAASLKVQYKEVSSEFYQKYFELFKKACCYRNSALSKDMTFDELLNKCNEIAGTNNIKQATSRLAYDIEMVLYARTMPNRQLVAIETDIKEVLNSL